MINEDYASDKSGGYEPNIQGNAKTANSNDDVEVEEEEEEKEEEEYLEFTWRLLIKKAFIC